MKKIIFFLFFSLFLQSAIAQTTTDTYWIRFKDKGSNFFTTDPSAYLSTKSIERRSKQNIPITASDLPVNLNYIAQIRAMDIRIVNQSKWFNAITVNCDANKINEIRTLPFVVEVKKISSSSVQHLPSKFYEESNTMPVPDEKSGRSSSASSLNYGASYGQAHQISVDCLHNSGYLGQGITIAVLDAGFFGVDTLPAFDSLRLNDQLLGTRDFVTGDTMVFEDYPHGMNVLSCMVGNLPGQLIGTAPKADYWLLRTENAFSESILEEITWATAAEFADSVGADVINSSLGYNYFDNSADNHTYSDMDGNTTIITKAADIAAGKGMVVVISAGNYGGAPWYKITAPADADSVLTVGAVDSAGFIASLSSRGLTYDGRIKPDVVARGILATVAGNNGGITSTSGTSFSAPIVAGAVACLWQANPTATNMELIAAIRQSASQFNNPDSVKGYGIPNFCAAGTILIGIDEHPMLSESLNVYPNPFRDNFDITFYSDKKQVITLELFDALGHQIFKQQKNVNINSHNKFTGSDTRTLSDGLYLLRLTASDKIYYKKVLKSK